MESKLDKAVAVFSNWVVAAIDRDIMDHVKYGKLLDKVRWFFEAEDALRVVRLRVSQGKATIGTYKDLAKWAGDVESELRRECDGK